MSDTAAKLRYLARSALDCVAHRHFACQNCGVDDRQIVDHKYIVTQLNRCNNCKLLYRTPTDTKERNASFYGSQGAYSEAVPAKLPSAARLAQLVDRNFADTPYDYAHVVRTLGALGLEPGARIFDFGCAWGYGSYQLRAAGYDVVSFEISEARFAYAREQLGIVPLDPPAEVSAGHPQAASFDCFFSSHVLEHVPSPDQVFQQAGHLVKPGGLFVSQTPNGAQARRFADPNWSFMWGLVHPNCIDEIFLGHHFQQFPHVFTSRDQETARGCPLLEPEGAQRAARHLREGSAGCVLGALEKAELLFAARLLDLPG